MRQPLFVAIVGASLLALFAGCSAPEDDNPPPVALAKDRGAEVVLPAADPAPADKPAVVHAEDKGEAEVIVRARYSEFKIAFDTPEKGKDARAWRQVGKFTVLEVVKGEWRAKAFEVMANTLTFMSKGFRSGNTYTLRLRFTRSRWLGPDGPWMDESEIEVMKG